MLCVDVPLLDVLRAFRLRSLTLSRFASYNFFILFFHLHHYTWIRAVVVGDSYVPAFDKYIGYVTFYKTMDSFCRRSFFSLGDSFVCRCGRANRKLLFFLISSDSVPHSISIKRLEMDIIATEIDDEEIF